MDILITGANGFLGGKITRRITEDTQFDVIAMARSEDKVQKMCVQEHIDKRRIQFVSMEDFLKNGFPCHRDSVFINCLFPTNADGYKMADGLEKVYRIISMAKKSCVGAFINISSQSVYASKRIAPAKEEDALSLETPYAVGKYSSEVFVNQVFNDVPHTNIRMASLLGVEDDQRIVNRMVDQALKGVSLQVVGGMQRYGFLDVQDAAEGIATLAQSAPRTWKEVYNLGRNESYTLMDVVECIVSEMKEQVGMEITYTVSEGHDVRNSSLNAEAFMSDFHWTPKITLSETIAAIIRSKVSKVEN